MSPVVTSVIGDSFLFRHVQESVPYTPFDKLRDRPSPAVPEPVEGARVNPQPVFARLIDLINA